MTEWEMQDLIVEKEGTKRPFDLNGWDYTSAEGLHKFIDQISSRCGAQATELRELLERGGGKAFGLRVCELIAQFDPGHHLVVPKWEIFDPSKIDAYKEWRKQSEKRLGVTEDDHSDSLVGLLLRSSAREEDWMNSGAGDYFTTPFIESISTFVGTGELQPVAIFYLPRQYWDNPGAIKGVPFVLQERKEGFGVVVDIAYSELYSRVVARVASGLSGSGWENGKYATSATNDLESPTAIFDETGEPVLPAFAYNRNKWYKSLFSSDFDFKKFVETLSDCLEKAGINFGVQMEFRINPEENEWWLVQVRPSPGALQSQSPEASPDIENYEEVATTAKVSRPFRYMSSLLVADRTLLDYLFVKHKKRILESKELQHYVTDSDTFDDIVEEREESPRDYKPKDIRRMKKMRDIYEKLRSGLDETSQEINGSVVQVTRSALSKHWEYDRLDVLAVEEMYMQLLREGAGAIISTKPIMCNVSHGGGLELRLPSEEAAQLMNSNVMSIDKSNEQTIKNLEGRQVLLISDGLVGKILVEKN